MVNNKTLTTKLDKEKQLTRRTKHTKLVSVFVAKRIFFISGKRSTTKPLLTLLVLFLWTLKACSQRRTENDATGSDVNRSISIIINIL